MNFRLLLTWLVWGLLYPMISLQAQCDCIPASGPVIDPLPTIELCDGDSTSLTVEIQPGSFSSFPDAYFIERDNNRVAQEWVRYNTDTGFVDSDDLTSWDAVIGGATFKGDSVYYLMRPGLLLRTLPDVLPLELDTLSSPSTRQGQFWVGLAYDESTDTLYALSNRNNQNTSLLYSLNEETGDTSLVSSLPEGARWLTSDDNGTLYVGFSTTDALYSFDLNSRTLDSIGEFGFNSRPCQGADFDRGSGILYGLFLDGNDDSVLGIIDTESGEFCSFDTINQQMNCPMVIKDSEPVSSDYSFSWTPTTNMIGPLTSNPEVFPSDTTTYTVTVTDSCGNSSSSSVIVNVIQAPDPLNSQACLSDVNITLGQDCSAEITPDALLTPDYQCPNQFYEVTIAGRPDPIVDGNDLGQTIEATVQPVGGGNSCTSNVTVNDDMIPAVINCSDVTLSFGDVVPDLTADDNCDPNPTIINLGTTFTDTVSCSTPFFYAATQTAVAEDASGNRSAPCTRTAFFLGPQASDVEFPDSLSEMTSNFLSCNDVFPTMPNGLYPTPEFSGTPDIGGIDINDYPPQIPIDANFQDIPVVTNPPCKVSFIRNWFVIAWDCNQPDTIARYSQLIQILDKEGPTFSLPQIDTLSTNSTNSCEVSVTLPYPNNANDNCTDIDRVDVTYGFNSIPDLQPGGASVNLPLGSTEVVYRVYDGCINSTTDTLMITVIDENVPTVVCRSANVGLNNTGPTRVYAQSFDDGSFDDCGPITLEVARMDSACGYDTSFGPFIEVTCCDVADEVMVILRATDEAGNMNECMTTLDVQDKTPAQIVAPDDITVSCEFPVDPNDLSIFGKVVVTDNVNAINNRSLEPGVEDIVLTDPGVDPVGPTIYGQDGVAYDNCDVTVQDTSVIEELNCNALMIERTFLAVVNGEIEAQAIQRIYVENIAQFSEDDIVWPKDTMLINACNGVETDPENLDTPHAFPRFTSGPCNNVVISDPQDTRFFTLDPNDPTCYKILRKWQVMDWCSPLPNGDPLVFEHHQLIKVVNNDGPEFTSACDDQIVCTTDGECGTGFLSLSQEAVDDCTPEADLEWSYIIDLDSDGDIDEFGNSSDASGNYPLGTHRITWTVEDGCNNRTSCAQIFEVEACKDPTPICNPGITVELTPMFIGPDTFAMSEITAELIGGNSFHACGYDVTVSFSEDTSDQTLVLDCDDVGVRDISIYVTDENGRQDFCRTYVLVQDNQLVCGNDPGPSFPVSGSITNSSTSRGLPNTEIEISGGIEFMTMSDEEGYFEFPGLLAGQSYTIEPGRDGDDLNGVNTFDILLMQQHILGLTEFDSPYKYIAADIDHNQRITGRDIIQLRRVILGIDDSFPENTSWRFADAEFDFGSGDPLALNFPESYEIRDLTGEMHIEFEPIKIGDLNMSANFNDSEAQTRFDANKNWYSQQEDLKMGQPVSIPVYVEDAEDLLGFQIQWEFNPQWVDVQSIRSEQIDIQSGNWVLGEDFLRISWSQAYGAKINPEKPVFYIDLTSQRANSIAQVLSLASAREFSSEVYTSSGEYGLTHRVNAENLAMPSFELKQNRPNPATDITIIDVQVPVTMPATLVITNGTGKEVYRERALFSRGWNQFEIQTSNFGPSGIYFYSVSAGPFNDSKKMILID